MPWPTRSLAFAGSDAFAASSALLGAYALSFLAALSSAVVAGLPALLRCPRERRAPLARRVALAALLPLALAALLGRVGSARVADFGRRSVAGEVASTRPLVAIQGDIPQELKLRATAGGGAFAWDPGEFGPDDPEDDANRIFLRHRRLTRRAIEAATAEGSLPLAVLWPETMIPWHFVDPAVARTFHDPAKPDEGPWANQVRILWRLAETVPPGTSPLLLVGVLHLGARDGRVVEPLFANAEHYSLVLLDPRLLPAPGSPAPPPPAPGEPVPWELGRHDKSKLVPGGETTPLGDWLPFLRGLRNAVSPIPELDPGDDDQRPFPLGVEPLGAEGAGTLEVRAGTVICFELAFPACCRSWRLRGAHVLLNASNYGWFGETGFRAQIQAIARLRAAETATTVVMAGNRGPTLFFDPVGRPYGRFTAADAAPGAPDLPVGDDRTTWRTGWATGPLLADPELTPYVRWGDVPWWGLAALALALTVRRRRPRPEAPPAGAPGAAEPREML